MSRIDYPSGLLALGLMALVMVAQRVAFGPPAGFDVGTAGLAAVSGATALLLAYLIERVLTGPGGPPPV